MSKSQTLVYLDRSAKVLREQLAELSNNGLIRDLLVIAGPNDVERLHEGTYSPTSIDSELARVQLELIRVVALRIESAPSEQVLQLERETLASLRERGQQVGIGFKAFTVVVVSAGREVDASCFHPDWTANVVVVPEESAGGEGFIAIDLTPDKVEAVALAALALVGGLWSWIDNGVLDHEKAANVAGMTYIRMVRLTLRVVDAGDLTSRLIGWAMDPGGVWPIPNEYVIHDQPQEVVIDLAAQIAASAEARFTFLPFEPKSRPRPKAVGLFGALILFYSRLWNFVRSMPQEYVERLKNRVVNRVESFVQTQTFGADSSVVVRIAQRPETVAELVTTRVRAGLLTTLKEVGTSSVQPTPDTWAVIRSVSFGLIDGGDFHGSLIGSEPLWLGQRAVFTDRNLVAPSSGRLSSNPAFKLRALELCALGIETMGDTYLRPFDVPSVDLFELRLTECEDEARSQPDDREWLPELWRGLVQPDMLDGPLMIGGEAVDDVGVIDDEEEFTDQSEDEAAGDETAKSDKDSGSSEEAASSLPDPVLRNDPGALKEPPTRIFILSRLRERYVDWMGDRRESLVWNLGEHLHTAIDEAVHDFESASHAFEAMKAEAEENQQELEKVNHRMRKWAKVALLLIVLLVLSAIGAGVIVGLILAYYFIGAVFALVFAFPLMVYRSARELTRLEFRLEVLATQPELILERRRHASAEVNRLSNLSEQLSDWSEIISAVIHRPWGQGGATTGVEPWVAQSGSHVFSVGVPELDEVALESEIVRLRRHLARKDWLSKVYVQHEAEFSQRYARLVAGAPGLGSRPSADINSGSQPIGTMPHTGENVYRPRRQFLVDVINDRYADFLRSVQVKQLRANIDDETTPAMLSAVQCAVDDLSGLESTLFLRPVVEQTPLPTFARFLHQRVGGPSVQPQYSVFGASDKVGAQIPEDGHERVKIEIGGVSERYVLACLRVDVSQSLELTDITFVSAPRTMPAAPVAPVPDNPITTLG
jgi:hypothetical protein